MCLNNQQCGCRLNENWRAQLGEYQALQESSTTCGSTRSGGRGGYNPIYDILYTFLWDWLIVAPKWLPLYYLSGSN